MTSSELVSLASIGGCLHDGVITRLDYSVLQSTLSMTVNHPIFTSPETYDFRFEDIVSISVRRIPDDDTAEAFGQEFDTFDVFKSWDLSPEFDAISVIEPRPQESWPRFDSFCRVRFTLFFSQHHDDIGEVELVCRSATVVHYERELSGDND